MAATRPRNNNLKRLTAAILASYDRDKRTHRLNQAFLPSREKIVAVLELIRQLLFPGFFGHQELTRDNVEFHVGSLLGRISRELTEQICHCLCSLEHCPEFEICRRQNRPRSVGHCLKQAERITAEFLSRIPKLRSLLTLDAQAAYDGDPAAKSIDEIVYSYPGFYTIAVYRVAHELLTLGVPLMPRIMTEHAHAITGVDIHPGAGIGKRFFIDHGTGVVIGETSRIGDNVKIYQGVTLGAKSFPKDENGRVVKGIKRHPNIEDDVTIYAGATILGPVTIGKGSIVGGNVWLLEGVPAGTVVYTEGDKVHIKPAGKERDKLIGHSEHGAGI